MQVVVRAGFGALAVCAVVTAVPAALAQAPPDLGERPSVAVTVQGTGKGRVTSAPPSLDCARRCTVRFRHGATVILSATPAARSRFAGWTGACFGRSAWCIFTAQRDVTVKARFTRLPPGDSFDEVADAFVTRPVLNVTVSEGGGVTGSAGAIDCPSRCWSRFDTGSRVELHARPRAGFRLRGWSSLLAACGRRATCVVSMNTTTDVTANFARVKP